MNRHELAPPGPISRPGIRTIGSRLWVATLSRTLIRMPILVEHLRHLVR